MGKVTVDGSAPFFGSTVEFYGAESSTMPAVTGLVDGDGNYIMNEVAPGTYQIVVRPPSAKVAPGTPGVGVPAKYAKVGNGETITVGKGNMTHNLTLTR
jgi:hypothetical protein